MIYTRRIVLLFALMCPLASRAQETPPAAQQPAPSPPMKEETQKNPFAPCVQPPPMIQWQDYMGPLQKTVGVFARRLERRSVHSPDYKPGAMLCTLTLKGKFTLFFQDMTDPVTFLNVGFNSGIQQAQNTDPQFGQGAQGYGKRFGADFADQTSSQLFKVVAYPTIFREDPRYYRLGHVSFQRRFAHALEHAVVAHGENGKPMFNFSEWLGDASSVALSNLYHPGAKPGVGPGAELVALGVAQDAGFDVLREFWPEIAHKFRLPFRDQNEPPLPSAKHP